MPVSFRTQLARNHLSGKMDRGNHAHGRALVHFNPTKEEYRSRHLKKTVYTRLFVTSLRRWFIVVVSRLLLSFRRLFFTRHAGSL